ncbi:MAG: hypothetical protein KAG28_05250 [Cocleimonas sp.]|nr:hypothetical protein [Cocleimonas sp.]
MMRIKEIKFIFKRRINQIFFLVPLLILGLLFVPISYAERLDFKLAKSTYGPVKGNDTLGKIVLQHYRGSKLTKQQIMMGILRANPDAFIGRNIHFLLGGVTLHLPKERLIATIDHNQATTTINEHLVYFKKGKTGNFSVEPLDDTIAVVDKEDEGKAVEALNKIEPSVRNDTKTKNKIDEIEREIKNRQINKVESESTLSNTAKSQKKEGTKNLELESLKSKVTQLEEMLSKQKATKDQANTDNKIPKVLKDTLKTQQGKIDRLESEKKNKATELEQLKEKITTLESTLDTLAESNTTTEGARKDDLINDLKGKNSQLQQRLSVLRSELGKKQEEVEALNLEISRSKQEIGALEEKLANRTEETKRIDQKIGEAEEKLASGVKPESESEISSPPPLDNSTQITDLIKTDVAESGDSTFKMPLWGWLLPVLALLMLLGYLFKRSLAPSKNTGTTEDTSLSAPRAEPKKISIKDHFEEKSGTKPKNKAISTPVPDIIASASEAESKEAAIKINMARAYMDMDMPDAAIEILKEAYEEGSQKQQIETKHLLERLK